MKIYSAGGVLTKKENNQIFVLLVEHLDGTFVFPKGHVEEGETFQEAAKREIREEVGLSDIVIDKQLGVIKRVSKNLGNQLIEKRIVMFSVIINNYDHLKNTEEEYRWFDIDDVAGRLRYSEDRRFFLGIKGFLTLK
jgi:ADP-ribose pyrophosphatase YjhB (NUDIX family)